MGAGSRWSWGAVSGSETLLKISYVQHRFLAYTYLSSFSQKSDAKIYITSQNCVTFRKYITVTNTFDCINFIMEICGETI